MDWDIWTPLGQLKNLLLFEVKALLYHVGYSYK